MSKPHRLAPAATSNNPERCEPWSLRVADTSRHCRMREPGSHPCIQPAFLTTWRERQAKCENRRKSCLNRSLSSPARATWASAWPCAGRGQAIKFCWARARSTKHERPPIEFGRAVPTCEVEPCLHADAVQQAPVVALALPLNARRRILDSLSAYWRPGMVVIDTTVPLEHSVGGRLSHILPLWEGSGRPTDGSLSPCRSTRHGGAA